MEGILRTFREILRTELPQSTAGRPIIYGQEVMAFWHGDRHNVVLQDLPAIVLDSDRRHTEFATLHARDHDWEFSIICYVRLDDADFTTTLLHEMARLVDDVVSRHTRVWIFDKCMFCLNQFINPAHLTSHSAIDPYAADIRTDFEARWNVTHQVQGSEAVPTSPMLDDNTAYAMGYHRLYDGGSIATGGTFSFYYDSMDVGTTTPKMVLEQYRAERRRPVRLLSFTRVGDINYGVVPKAGGMYLRGAELKVSAKEIEPLTQFGV
jgi:hypothetical protein